MAKKQVAKKEGERAEKMEKAWNKIPFKDILQSAISLSLVQLPKVSYRDNSKKENVPTSGDQALYVKSVEDISHPSKLVKLEGPTS